MGKSSSADGAYRAWEAMSEHMDETDMDKTDMVNHPPHYNKGAVECIDAIAAATEGLEGIKAVCTANAIKYLWRWSDKGGLRDLDKAEWYIERLRREVGKT